jgi:delta-1-pyrroline-5-carboxylate synthetase
LQLTLKVFILLGLKSSLIARLGLTEKKLQTLSNGLQQIAENANVLGLFNLFSNLSVQILLGQIVRRTRLADGLILKQITTPIGVLLVIFESRPDSLPQIAALSICSGNGLLLKGGSEARYSNEILTKLMQDALEPFVPRETITLVNIIYSLFRREESYKHKLSDCLLACVSAPH